MEPDKREKLEQVEEGRTAADRGELVSHEELFDDFRRRYCRREPR
jgi:hypothetical protein